MIFKQLICFVVLAAGVHAQSYTRVNVSCSATSYWNNQWCVPCAQGCSCSTPGGCTKLTCGVGQVADTTSNTCVYCPVGCNTCTFGTGQGNFQCQTCSSGYTLVQNVCVQLVSEPEFEPEPFSQQPTYDFVPNYFTTCSQIDQTTSLCSSCPTGSFLNEINACELCVTGCSSCNSRGTCSQCADGTQWVPNAYPNAGSNINTTAGQFSAGSGACLPCNDVNALTCNQNQQNAITCSAGYYISTTTAYQTCSPCPIGCTSCTSASVCTSCSNGYYMSSNLCNLCSANQQAKAIACSTCSSTTCTACNTAAGYIMLNNQCIICSTQITGCAVCGASGSSFTCNICSNGYYRVFDSTTNIASCTPCSSSGQNTALYCYQDDYSTSISPIITQCGSYNLLVPQQSGSTVLVCATNPNNCLTMSDAATQNCLTCIPGWLLVNGQCVLCSNKFPGCTSCTVSGSTISCNLCQTGFYLANAQDGCSLCSSGCVQCSGSQTCTQCANGYLLSSGACSPCQQSNCMTCNPTTTCTACNNGFYLQSVNGVNTCLQCPYGCSQCSATSGQTCTSCLSGFYPHNSGCSAGVQYCASYSSTGACTQCQYGFRLSNNGQCLACIGFNGGYVCNQNAGLFCSANYLNWTFIAAILVFLILG